MSIAQLETLYQAAVDALDSGDYDTAIRKALALKARLATTANVTRNLAGGGSQGLTWGGAAELNEFIAQCRKLKAESVYGSAGLQQIPITYKRPSAVEE